jgi:penicillin V acylase-like amidase (Ntn superfamily)
MISDKNGNTYIVEPGRGNIYSRFNESPYFVMTNFSLIDDKNNNCKRYAETEKLLIKEKNLNVSGAFKILEKVKQDGEWKTEFSMVYSQKENKVYYCYNANYKNILEYKFK